MITAIVCSDSKGNIADDQGRLPWMDCKSVAAEIGFFRETTRDSNVIVGSKTIGSMIDLGFGFETRNKTIILAGKKFDWVTKERSEKIAEHIRAGKIAIMNSVQDVMHEVIASNKRSFCVGGLETWFSFAPFTTRILKSTVEKTSEETKGWKSIGDSSEFLAKMAKLRESKGFQGTFVKKDGIEVFDPSGIKIFTTRCYEFAEYASGFSNYVRWSDSLKQAKKKSPIINYLPSFELNQ